MATERAAAAGSEAGPGGAGSGLAGSGFAGSVTGETFGLLPDGTPVPLVRLNGPGGFALAVIAFGAAVQALHVPDRTGVCADVVLGHDTLGSYLAHRACFGASVGRYANRIGGGGFMLDGRRIALPANDGANCLHGGPDGFDRRLWSVEAVHTHPVPAVTLALTSPHGDAGFPGTLSVRVTYALETGANGAVGFSVTFAAETDAPTVVCLTHHGYFNLAGATSGRDVLDHVLTIAADSYLPVSDALIPEGGPAPVAGTPFDFTSPRPIGAHLRAAHPQLLRARGYDHTYCLGAGPAATPRFAARVVHPASGRVMELLTDQPGLQFYSGNALDGRVAGKGGRALRQSDGFCLEPQAWPDSPNRPDFTAVRLEPGASYRHRSVFLFAVA